MRDDPAELEYTGGDRGWKGDVPVVRLNTDASAAWAGPTMTSRQALRASIVSLLADSREGKFG